MSENKNGVVGLSLLDVLLVIFIVLKLIGVITWSWWLVLMPLWIELALIVIAIIIVFIYQIVTRRL